MKRIPTGWIFYAGCVIVLAVVSALVCQETEVKADTNSIWLGLADGSVEWDNLDSATQDSIQASVIWSRLSQAVKDSIQDGGCPSSLTRFAVCIDANNLAHIDSTVTSLNGKQGVVSLVASTGVGIDSTNNSLEITTTLGTGIDSTEVAAGALSVTDIGQYGATTGEVLEWDGAKWAPGTDGGAAGSDYADSLRNASATHDVDTFFPDATETVIGDTLRVNESGTLRLEYAESNDANTGGETDTVAVIDANGIIKKGNHPLSDVGSGSGGGYVSWADRDTLEYLWNGYHYSTGYFSPSALGPSNHGLLPYNATTVRWDRATFFIPGGLGDRDTCEVIIAIGWSAFDGDTSAVKVSAVTYDHATSEDLYNNIGTGADTTLILFDDIAYGTWYRRCKQWNRVITLSEAASGDDALAIYFGNCGTYYDDCTGSAIIESMLIRLY
jgi:hypothetical protein